MLSKIRIKNFKCFSDTDFVQIKPITLLFGKNSSGKTSFLDALYLFKQTVEDPETASPVVDNGSTFKFGHYSDYVHRHQDRHEMEFAFVFSVESGAEGDIESSAEEDTGPLGMRGGEVRFTLALRYIQHLKRIQPSRIEIGDAERCFVKADYSPNGEINLREAAGLPQNKFGEARKYLKLETFYKFVPGVYPQFALSDLSDQPLFLWLANVSLAITLMFREFKKIVALGPLREYPERRYVLGGGRPTEVGYQGKQALPLLYEGSARSGVNTWLQNAKLCDSLSFPREGETHFRPKVQGSHEELDDLPDTGFGISQVLPVVAAVLSAEKGSIVCIEQPELHLHPFAATRLADLFVAAASAGATSIVETHSEHLLIRLQNLVATRAVVPEQIALYFFEKGPQGATLRSMSIREDGVLESAPEGFFSEDYQELVEMQKSVATRNQAK